jgi:hypothetical protein
MTRAKLTRPRPRGCLECWELESRQRPDFTIGLGEAAEGSPLHEAATTGLTDPRITTLAVDPRDSRILYASTAGGVFRSADGASTWQRFNLGLGPYGVNAFAIDPAGRSVYAGGQPGGASMPPTGIEPVHAV